jgi:hypothetical protein
LKDPVSAYSKYLVIFKKTRPVLSISENFGLDIFHHPCLQMTKDSTIGKANLAKE